MNDTGRLINFATRNTVDASCSGPYCAIGLEAQATVATELTRARSQSQRSSTDQTVTWTASTINIGTKAVPVPNGTLIANAVPASAYKYTAPYGEFTVPNGADPGLVLELVDATGRYHTAVIAMGVTGKVVRRGVVPLATPIN